jgi:opacity protein-like surface antigen
VKKIFLLLFSALLSLSAVLADTDAPSVIKGKEAWIPAKSPYIVDGTVTIEKTGLLTIYPGTVVKFKKDSKIFVKGALYSKGDPKNPVRMLPFDITSFYDGLVFESRYKSTVEFTILIRGAITSKGSNVNITNNYILNSTGIELFHFANVFIKDNYFYNDTYGIYVEGKEIKYSALQNTFNNCRFAIYVKDTPKNEGIVTKNNFFKNVVDLTDYSPADIDCRDNYWGFDTEKTIQEFIYDKKDNQKAGSAVFEPFAKTPYPLWEPTDAFISLVKIYLNLRRPDEETAKVSFGGGVIGLMPLAPKYLATETKFGFGAKAEFSMNLTNVLLIGVSLEGLELSDKKGDSYDYSMGVSNLYLNATGYLGYKKDFFIMPYARLGAGAALISEQYRYTTGDTTKHNNICFAAAAGAGLEWFPLKFFSLKFEADFNAALYNKGAILYPVAGITGNLYFDTPFYVNDRGMAGPY